MMHIRQIYCASFASSNSGIKVHIALVFIQAC